MTADEGRVKHIGEGRVMMPLKMNLTRHKEETKTHKTEIWHCPASAGAALVIIKRQNESAYNYSMKNIYMYVHCHTHTHKKKKLNREMDFTEMK